MRRFIIYTMLLVILISFAGCASFDVGSLLPVVSSSKSTTPTKAAGSGEEEILTISGLTNNSEKQLNAGTYNGLTIDFNSVVLTGRGSGKTIIVGDVIIKKNNCVIKNLTIRGNVVIEGNNADLTKAQIQGNVDSKGKNNNW